MTNCTCKLSHLFLLLSLLASVLTMIGSEGQTVYNGSTTFGHMILGPTAGLSLTALDLSLHLEKDMRLPSSTT